MRMTVAKTPEGVVVREIFPSGERSWRLRNNSEWDHCADHKGPWVCTTDVPREIVLTAKGYLARHGAD